jgi:hypothetical protein
MQPWIDVLVAVDYRGDKAPLIELLKSNKQMPEEARWYIGDLLARYLLKRPKGRRTTPAYDRSLAEMRLIWAEASVREHMKGGMKAAKAIEGTLPVYGVQRSTQAAYHAGRLGSARRMKKRRPPLSR